jgi:tetratricopeptide (TPR) repeat protein
MHAPNLLDTDDRLIGELINHCRSNGVDENEIDLLENWRSISSGNPDENLEQMSDPSSKLNHDAEVIQSLAIRFVRQGQTERAENLLVDSPEISDPDGWSALLLGICYAASSRYAHARHALREAKWNPAIQPIVDYLVAQTWLTEGNTQKALESLNAAVAAWPQEPQWQFELAEAYMAMDELDHALPHFQHAVEWMAENQAYRLSLGRVQRQLGIWTEAYTNYAQVLDSFPNDGNVWKESAQVALVTGHARQALDWFERACTLLPSDPHCLIGAARAAISLGNQRQALDLAKSALRVAPNDYEVLLGIGEILAAQGKVDKALESYDKALELTENPLNIHLARTKLLIQTGRAAEAQVGLRSALEQSPDSHEGWAALAEAHEVTGELEQAEEAIAEAIRHAPRDPLYHLRLGRLSRITGQLDRAVDELQHAQSLSPTDPQIAIEIGMVFETRRESERALEAYERAIAIDPNNAESHLRAGLLLKEKKAYPQAANMIERAVALNPRDPKILHQLAAVRALELVHGGFLNTVVSS